MRIISGPEFLVMPAGTLFSKYEPCLFGDLRIKGDTWTHDFLYDSITDAIVSHDSNEFAELLFAAEADSSKSLPMDFEGTARDGMYDDEQLFAVWEQADVSGLIERLQKAISQIPPSV